MVVAPAVPARTVRELVAHMKANPGKLTFGYGLATTPHILAETFRQATGADFAGVPYRGGEQARADLLGGRIDINMAPTSNLLAIIQDSRARPLAFTGPKRERRPARGADDDRKRLPHGRLRPGCLGWVSAPAGTPAEVVDKINAAVNESLKSDDMKAVLAKLGWEPMSTTPSGFTAFIAGEVKKWPPLAASRRAEGGVTQAIVPAPRSGLRPAVLPSRRLRKEPRKRPAVSHAQAE